MDTDAEDGRTRARDPRDGDGDGSGSGAARGGLAATASARSLGRKSGPLVAPRRSLIRRTLSRRLSGVRTLGRTAARQRVAVIEHPNSPWIVDVSGIRDDEEPVDPDPRERIRLQRMETYLEAAKSADPDVAVTGLRCLRFLYSSTGRVPIWLMIESQLHAALVTHLQPGADEVLLFETTWVLAQLTKTRSRANMEALLSSNVISELARILDLFVSPRVSEQSLRCLGRLAHSSLDVRDQILANESIVPVLNRIGVSSGPMSMFGALASTICYLVHGAPAPSRDAVIEPLMPTVAKLLELEDMDTVSSLILALAYLAESDPAGLGAIKELGMAVHLTAALDGSTAARVPPAEPRPNNFGRRDEDDPETMLLAAALRTVVGLANAGADFIQELIDAGVLEPFRTLIDHQRRDVRVLTARAISTMALGTQDQIQALLDADLAEATRHRLDRENHTTVKKGIALFYARVCIAGTPGQIAIIISHGGMRSMWHVAGLIGTDQTTETIVAATEAALMTVEGALARQALVDIEEAGLFDVLDRQNVLDLYFARLTEAMFFAESRAA